MGGGGGGCDCWREVWCHGIGVGCWVRWISGWDVLSSSGIGIGEC